MKKQEIYYTMEANNGKFGEETVCNILSGMYRSTKHQNVVNSCRSTETDAIDNFKVAEYTESIDAKVESLCKGW